MFMPSLPRTVGYLRWNFLAWRTSGLTFFLIDQYTVVHKMCNAQNVSQILLSDYTNCPTLAALLNPPAPSPPRCSACGAAPPAGRSGRGSATRLPCTHPVPACPGSTDP